MIVTLTKKELETVEKKVDKAEKLYKEALERARSLRPEAPEPPYTGVKDEDKVKVYEEWIKTGSDEWRQAFNEAQALDLDRWGKNDARAQATREADEKLLKKITKSQDATVKELKRQVGIFLQTDFIYLEDKTNGYFVPNFDYIREELRDLFYKPMQTLDAEKQVEIENYIDLKAGELPPKVSSYTAKYSLFCGLTTPQEGTDSGKKSTVKHGKHKGQEIAIPCNYSIYCFIPALNGGKHETTEEREYYVTRPKDYVTTVDRPTQKLFNNALTKPLDADAEALYDVRLDRKDRVSVRVAIDYSEVLSKGTLLELPELNQRDYNVHDAIITQLCAGNRVMSYDMIYRAMTGKVGGKITVPCEARKIIDEALDKFRGTFKLEYTYIEDGKEIVESYDEPLVTFRRLVKKEKINGKVVTGGIALSDDTKLDPPLLKWARFNGNEIDTRDITLLDVPSLNNGDESFTIKMCLYRRVISMRNSFERKYHSKKELPDNLRSIRYDYVYSMIGLEEPDKNKRRLIKDKIDRCMSYWKDKGLIADYRHKTDKSAGNAFYAVEVSFMASKK